jgi:hypothetical protein
MHIGHAGSQPRDRRHWLKGSDAASTEGSAWPDRESAPQAKGVTRSSVAAVGAVLSVILLYAWDDALFAAPIVAGTRWLGAWTAFIVFSVIYGVVSFTLAILAVRAYDRRSGGRENRLARWVERQSHSQRAGWIGGLLTSGKVVGFFLSSFLIGGIVTTFIIRLSGRRDHLTGLAAASSAIFSLTFVGLYTGVGRVIFGR